ncbi:hypothetical protein CP532_4146, partial [Ophiocordyceps camponoti-leonardi (nom. inval.)]
YYETEGHASQDDCFRARFERTDWTYQGTDCMEGFEGCDGADVMCSRVTNPIYRGFCFEGYNHAPYLDPFSEGRLGPNRKDDERCVGTKAFCEDAERIESYGSTEACLKRRTGKPSSPSDRQPGKADFLPEDQLACRGDPTEKCLGTEKFCGQLQSSQQKEQCLTSRRPPQFYTESSTECDPSKGEFSEPCLGTEKWCANELRVELYGSEEKCRDFRRKQAASASSSSPRGGPWIAPDYECLKNGDGTEKCEGTERFCQFRSPSSDACFAARELGPFLLPAVDSSSTGCSGAKEQQGGEACAGTDSWCHDGFRQNNYRNEDECFRRRGFEQEKMARKVVDRFEPLFKDTILQYAKNVTLNAVYRDLIREAGNETSAMNAVGADLGRYHKMLKEEVLSSAIEKAAPKDLQWHKPQPGCTKYEEVCLGTDVWCSKPEYYKKDGYDSQRACFIARREKTPWRYINSECLADFEHCDGTDVVCSRVQDPGYRDSCFAARTRAAWLPKWAPGCLAAGNKDDERCAGTKDFCNAEARIKSYGSAETCLSRREAAPKGVKKPEFLLGNFFKCFGDKDETCKGTEEFCSSGRLSAEEVLACIESRANPPFYEADSPTCTSSPDGWTPSEACLGTSKWCADKSRVGIYGSKDRCEAFRKKAEKKGANLRKWVAPSQACRGNDDQSEQCKGTEYVCQWNAPISDFCFSDRETGPFLLPKKPGTCPKAESAMESCLGTDNWCHERYQQNNYPSEGECFSRRGFTKHDQMVKAIVEKMSPVITKIILDKGKEIVNNTVYYQLIHERGDEKSTKTAIIDACNNYLEKLEKETLPKAMGEYMKKVRRAAGA